MSLLALVLVLTSVGVVLWSVNTYLPMAQPVKTLLNVVVVLVLLVWLANAFGVLAGLRGTRVPRIR